ncbi:MAG TPA: CHY zinc finger protein [Chthoniobacterales bacterium]|nr:CHY zinc finger protein [Chthoniobacterales bacterium]
MKIHDATVMGVDVDPQTRCAHYHNERDIIAIKFKCCGKWFSCHQCHATLAGHTAEVWLKEEFGERSVLCGNCGEQLSIREYLQCESVCPHCEHQFNPGCARHHHLYFEM